MLMLIVDNSKKANGTSNGAEIQAEHEESDEEKDDEEVANGAGAEGGKASAVDLF